MEWLVLLLLVPAILVPVVLLCGFAGCGFNPTVADPDPLAPTGVSSTAVTVSTIDLTWANPNPEPVTFVIERTRDNGSPVLLTSAAATLHDSGLDEATVYFYRVKALRTADQRESAFSDQATARTSGVAFEAALTTDQTGLEGFTLVQRIEPARLLQSTLPGDASTPGARIRITLRGSTTGSLTLDRIYISQPALSGDPYDADSDLTSVASGVVVSGNTSVVVGGATPIHYALDRTKPLLVAFDIREAPGSGNVRFITNVPASEATVYVKGATSEASIGDRAPSEADPGATPFNAFARIYLIERIEVV